MSVERSDSNFSALRHRFQARIGAPLLKTDFIQFFTANIRNRNTRRTYARAVKQFFEWTESRGLDLESIDALAVAAYIERKLVARCPGPVLNRFLAGFARCSTTL